MECGVCGSRKFKSFNVIWDKLANDWQLSRDERAYVDRQQGEICEQCGSNLRSIALANALRKCLGTREYLVQAAQAPSLQGLRILEINEAGTLTPVLRRFANHTFSAYPDVDMHALPFEDCTFDIVIHSDTLEHVPNPVHALGECRRVLKHGGALCFTVPVIVGRMSRNRDGLAKSHHGNMTTHADDWVVHTEFGADAWCYLFAARFSEVAIVAVEYPAATAFVARR